MRLSGLDCNRLKKFRGLTAIEEPQRLSKGAMLLNTVRPEGHLRVGSRISQNGNCVTNSNTARWGNFERTEFRVTQVFTASRGAISLPENGFNSPEICSCSSELLNRMGGNQTYAGLATDDR